MTRRNTSTQHAAAMGRILAFLFAAVAAPAGCGAPANQAPANPPALAATPAAPATPRFRQECLDLKPLQIGGNFRTPPRALRLNPPDLSHLRTALRLQGVVIVATVIDRDGRVCDAQVVRGLLSDRPNLINEPVRQAILTSTFTPATLDGHPVAVVYYLTVRIGSSSDENPSFQRTRPG